MTQCMNTSHCQVILQYSNTCSTVLFGIVLKYIFSHNTFVYVAEVL